MWEAIKKFFSKGKQVTTTVVAEVTLKPKDPERVSVSVPGQKLLSCPLASQALSMSTKGTFRKGYPEGLVVHFTAGRCDSDKDMEDSISWGKGEGFSFWGIGPSGKIYQTHKLDKWGYHAGKSFWPSLGSSVSQYLLGVEIAAAGMTDSKGKSWFGKTYAHDRLRSSERKSNIKPGTYVKYTSEQEESLVQLCVWLYKNNPGVFKIENIVGHDEIAPDRKNDPGAALSMTMPEFRKHIAELAKA